MLPAKHHREVFIYILLSIKTRIETTILMIGISIIAIFISYYPLKQGLKLEFQAKFIKAFQYWGKFY